MSAPLPQGVTIPLDVLDRPFEERIQLAIATIRESGTKPDGNPFFSARQAEKHFQIPRSTLGCSLQGV